MRKKKVNFQTIFLLSLIGLLILLGVAVTVISNLALKESGDKRSFASGTKKNVVTTTNMGLKASVSSMSRDSVSIDAKWDKGLTTDPNLLFFTLVVKASSQYRNQNDTRRQNDDSSRRIDKNENKATLTGLPMCPGSYDVVLRGYYQNNIVKVQTIPLQYEGPITDQGRLLVGNTSFETKYNDPASPDDLDPDCWEVIEGRAEPGTGNIIEDKLTMIQTVSNVGSISPKSGSYMLENKSEYNLKSHFRYFFTPVSAGTLRFKFALYIPEQPDFLNQAEIRKAAGGENIHIQWTEQYTRYCWRLGSNPGNGKDYCKDVSKLATNTWHNYVVEMQKIPTSPNTWTVGIDLDGANVIKSNGSTIPHMKPLENRFGFVFLGDECQNGPQQPCEGIGKFYYDDVELYSLP